MQYYDLYVPIGDTCRTAYHLKKNDLRLEAYPLDWMFGYSLDTVIHLFKTQFDDFFIEIEDDSVDWDGKCRKIKDVKNNICSVHHFPWDKDIVEVQKEFLQKMKKRYKSMENKLRKANRVVLFSYRKDSVDELQRVLNEFSMLYPHLEIKLVNIRNNVEMNWDSYDMKQYFVSERLSIEDYSFNDTVDANTKKKAIWSGNVAMWSAVIKKFYNENKQKIMQKLVNEKPIVIYGAGSSCAHLIDKFMLYDIPIRGIAVTDTINNPKSVRKYEVSLIEKYDKNDKIIISIIDKCEADKIKEMLLSKGYKNLFFVEDYEFLYKDYVYALD